MPRRYVIAIMMIALVSGCYRYVPAASSDLAPGSRVRIDLATSQPLSVVADSGPATYRNVGAVRGHVVAHRGDSLVLREIYLVPADQSYGRRALAGQVSYVAETSDRVYQRRLDVARTALAVLVPVGLIAYFLSSLEYDTATY